MAELTLIWEAGEVAEFEDGDAIIIGTFWFDGAIYTVGGDEEGEYLWKINMANGGMEPVEGDAEREKVFGAWDAFYAKYREDVIEVDAMQ